MRQIVLNKFDIGIIDQIAATKIPMDAATDLLDADIRFGDLRPVATSPQMVEIPRRLSLQDGNRSIVRFGEYYFWTDNATGETGSTLGYMGIDPPASAPSVKFGARGNRFAGRYRYTTTFSTREGVESAPAIRGGRTGIDASVEILAQPFTEVVTKKNIETSAAESPFDFYHIANSTTAANRYNPRDPSILTTTRTYGYNQGEVVSYEGRTYRAKVSFTSIYSPGNVNDPLLRDGRVVIHPTQYPGANATLWQDMTTALATEVVQTEWTGYDSLLLSNIPSSSENAVTVVNVYRTVGDGSEFFLVASLANGTSSFQDTVSDEALVSSSPMFVLPIYPPVQAFDNSGVLTQQPCRYLTDQLELFYIASGRRVYISEQGNPHAWDIRKFLELDDTCTGLARYRDGILAFTRNRTFQIRGSAIADIEIKWIPEYQGCKDWRTIAYMNNSPTWVSNDGLCQYGFVPDINTEILQTLTVRKFRWPNIVWATSANRKYYGVAEDGTAVVYDFEAGGAISRVTMNARYAEYDADNDRIVFVGPDGLYYALHAGAGTVSAWSYTSPVLTLETQYTQPGLRRIRSAWVRCGSDVELTLEVDGVAKLPVVSKFSTPYRRVFFAPGMTGTQFRVTLSSGGKLDQIAIEWEELRKNG